MDIAMDRTTGELLLVAGDLALVRDDEATAQFLYQKLRLFLTEWFLDQSKGINYFDQILIKNPNPAVINSIFKSEIINAPGIVELTSFTLDIDFGLRKLDLAFQARTRTGIIDFSETIGV